MSSELCGNDHSVHKNNPKKLNTKKWKTKAITLRLDKKGLRKLERLVQGISKHYEEDVSVQEFIRKIKNQ